MKFRSRSKASRGKNSDRKAGEVGGQPNSPPSCTLVHPLRKRFPLDLEISRGPLNHHLRTPESSSHLLRFREEGRPASFGPSFAFVLSGDPVE